MIFLLNIISNKVREKFKIKKLIFVAYTFLMLLVSINHVYATDVVSNSLGFSDYVSSINEYVNSSESEDIVDISSLAKDLITTNNYDYSNIVSKLLGLAFKEVLTALRGGITIYIVILLMAVLSSLELDKDSSMTKISYFVCFLTIATVAIKTFVETIVVFKGTVGILTTLMQIISPFLMTILIATGAITSTGIIQPMLLFLASLVSFIINYVVIPFLSISIAFNIIDSLSEKIKLNRMSKLFSKSALWIVGIALTIFLGILSLETNITASVDSLAFKTTQAAVSNFVPVVGKFFSDSFETVIGATKIVSRVGGTIGIIAIILVTIIPIIKILSIMVVYMILTALAEPVCTDSKIIKTLDMFTDTYKTLLGILIGVTILFVISTGIILNLSTSIVK